MRIGIDMRPLTRPTGVARVLRSILSELQEIDGRNTYFLYSNRDFDMPPGDGRWQKRVHPGLRYVRGTWHVYANRMIARDHPDVFWGPGHYLPARMSAEITRVLTIHDVVWKRYPGTMERLNLLMHRLFVERYIKEASVLIADSKSTARELQQLLGVPESKIRVVYCGVSSQYRPCPREVAANYISEKYHVAQDYMLALGTVEPRKNLVTLVEAVKILREKYGSRYQLVVAGAAGWKTSEIYASLKRTGLTGGEVVFPGYIEEDDLPRLYSGAVVFAMPSVYEGFGLPLLEAMACGVPVVSSDADALVEVGGDATLSVPSHRPDLLAEALSRACSDEALRGSMIEKGFVRARQFCWRRSARQVLEVLETACEGSRKQIG